jgi:hypothetical protein
MVAVVRDWRGEFLGITRTFLDPDGHRKSGVAPMRLSLGPLGGGAVHLAPAAEAMMVAEGIETALAAMEVDGRPAWATLGTSGLVALELPPLPLAGDVLILADNDANKIGQAAAYRAARRWKNEGRRVRIALPTDVDSDFCDLLNAEGE